MLDDIARRARQSHVKASLKKIPKKVITEAAPEKVMQLNYKPSDTFVKAHKQKLVENSDIYSFNKLKKQRPSKLSDITEWNSEFDANTKEHLTDFGKTIKYLFPAKVGEEGFVDFGQVYKLYESLGYSRTKNGIKYNLQLSGPNYGASNKFAGGPGVGSKMTDKRRVNQRKSGAKRAQNLAANGWSTDDDIANFKSLKNEVTEGNKRLAQETGVKPVGTTGFVLEHNILQSSRYWKVHKTKGKNSDAFNVFVWNNPKFVNYKGNVEEHIKRIPGEPFAIRMNGTLDKIEIIHIDTDRVIGEMQQGDDYRAIFKQLTKDFA